MLTVTYMCLIVPLVIFLGVGMSIKAELKIQLYANDVIVAESIDEHLWRKVLTAMQNDSGSQPPLETRVSEDFEDEGHEVGGDNRGSTRQGVSTLAKMLGVTSSELIGACDPTESSPFMHLDHKCWESFKKNTPGRGAGAIGPSQLVGTLLCLWFMSFDSEGKPTQAQTLEVLEGIGVQDKNASRSIKNCDWLQSRSDGIQINAAQISQAEKVAKAFVLKQRIDSE